MVEKIICSNCNGEHIKKDGKRKTENRGLIQRYKCLSCGKILNWEKDDISSWEFAECCGKKYGVFPVKYQVKVIDINITRGDVNYVQ
jgi:transposase-like protein